jgi:hypothetical protein
MALGLAEAADWLLNGALRPRKQPAQSRSRFQGVIKAWNWHWRENPF